MTWNELIKEIIERVPASMRDEQASAYFEGQPISISYVDLTYVTYDRWNGEGIEAKEEYVLVIGAFF